MNKTMKFLKLMRLCQDICVHLDTTVLNPVISTSADGGQTHHNVVTVLGKVG